MLRTFIGAVALAASVPAFAEQSRTVRYNDLNLASPAGIERLEDRINGAARLVCGARDDYRQSLILQAETRKCIADAKARAMAQVARLEAKAVRG